MGAAARSFFSMLFQGWSTAPQVLDERRIVPESRSVERTPGADSTKFCLRLRRPEITGGECRCFQVHVVFIFSIFPDFSSLIA